MTEAGYQPEVAYFECLHEMKLIVDLMYEGGMENMRYSISDTAQWGDFVYGPRVVNDETKARMKDVLTEIQNGQFAKGWILENQAGRPQFNAINNNEYNHPITKVGQDLRDLMPFVKQPVNDKKKNGKSMSRIRIFDTTLRDGEQSPGVNLNKMEKLEIAKQLERLGVDVMEAGFPAASEGDFQAVKLIADTIKNVSVTALARTRVEDIDRAYEALKNTPHPRIHIFLATSPIHMTYKLKMTPEQVIQQSVDMVKYAKEKFEEVEWSAEDATRSEWPFLAQVIEQVIEAGATVVNLPDTVGYTTPDEYGNMFKYMKENVPNIDRVDLSCHCHNDLGMAAVIPSQPLKMARPRSKAQSTASASGQAMWHLRKLRLH